MIGNGPLRVGIGGPVGSGKTALVERLCKRMREAYDIAVVTNDIYTKEDAQFLTRAGALDPSRIAGVETGGCPHTAIREDASINLAAVHDMVQAAVRVVPLGQSSGQRILSRLAAEIPAAVAHALACDEPQAFSPMLAILSSRHENQYSRLFRS